MVQKQAAAEGKKKTPLNQQWMEEFSSFSSDVVEEEGGAGGDFAALLERSEKDREMKEGQVIDGKIVSIQPDHVTVDIGFKCEGLIPLYEFKDHTGTANVTVGETMQVYIDKIEIE